MTVRFIRKQRKGIVQMGHTPPYLFAQASVLGDQFYLGGRFSASTNFESRTLNLKGPNTNNVYVGSWAADGTGLWVAQIYPDVGGRAFTPVKVQTGQNGVYVCFCMLPNITATTPITYTIENSDGTVGATIQTFNNVVGGQFADEAVIVKYDPDGFVLWVKPIERPQVAFVRTQRDIQDAVGVLVAEELGGDIMVFGHINNRSLNSGVTNTYAFGPLDTNVQTYALTQRIGCFYNYKIDQATGEIQANSLNVSEATADTDPERVAQLTNGGLQRGSLLPDKSLGMYGYVVFVNIGATYTFATNVNFGAVNILAPTGAVNLQRALLMYLNPDRTAAWGFSVHSTAGVGVQVTGNFVCDVSLGVNNSAAFCFFGYDSTDPSGARVIHYRDLLNTDIVGPTVNRGNGWFASYDSSGNLLWNKAVSSNQNEANGIRWFSSYEDPPTSTVVAVHRIPSGSITTVTWGAGELNRLVHAFPNAQFHLAVMKIDRATGDIVWVQPIEAGTATAGAYVGNVYKGADGNTHALIYFEERIDVNVLGVPQSISIGVGNVGVVDIALNPTTGAYVTHTVLFTVAAGTADVQALPGASA